MISAPAGALTVSGRFSGPSPQKKGRAFTGAANSLLFGHVGKQSDLPGALDGLDPGEYQVGLYFDDPYSTSVIDKVTIKVTDTGSSSGDDQGTEEGSGEGDSSQ